MELYKKIRGVAVTDLWCIHIAQQRNLCRDQLESIVSCRNVHTGPKMGQEPGPIVSYSTCPFPGTGPSPIPYIVMVLSRWLCPVPG